MNTMNVDEIARFAAKSQFPPNLTHDIDIIFYYQMREIYDDYKKHVITDAEGRARKAKAINEYHKRDGQKRLERAILTQNIQMWKNIEWAAMQYTANPCKDTADRFVAAVYGYRPHDIEDHEQQEEQNDRT